MNTKEEPGITIITPEIREHWVRNLIFLRDAWQKSGHSILVFMGRYQREIDAVIRKQSRTIRNLKVLDEGEKQ